MAKVNDKEIILKLGGSTKVAELLGFDKQRVQNWTVRGIPASIKLEYPHLFLNPIIFNAKKEKPLATENN